VRVDLLLEASGRFRACEINADCPGGHNEALGLPEAARAAGFTGGANPTRVVDALATRLVELAGGRGAVALIFATAYAEDLQVCALLQRAVQRRGVRAVLAPPTAPRFEDGALRIGGTRIGALYRFFPTEYMEGQKNLDAIEHAVRTGAVRTLSSFAHIYAQSKFAFARAWALAPELEAEHARTIHGALPATFDVLEIGAAEIEADRTNWVVKRALGRVGDQVFVGPLCQPDEWTAIVGEVVARCREGERWIAQRFIHQRPVPTPWGPRFVTLGAYVQDGRFTGYFARVTPESHVSHGALCVPVFTCAPAPNPNVRSPSSARYGEVA
jgi:hypothetical protein